MERTHASFQLHNENTRSKPFVIILEINFISTAITTEDLFNDVDI